MEFDSVVGWFLLIAILSILPFVFALFAIRKVGAKRLLSMQEKFAGRQVLLSGNANYFGLASRGKKQVRGAGILLLTKGEICFERLLPKLSVEIPIKRIRNIETPKMFLGKSIFKPLLKIDFFDEDGYNDEIGFYVKNLDQWTNTISKLQADIRK